jgi:hypothetical protein
VDHWVIKATSNENSKPGVFDEKVQPITEPSGFYPGCYAIAYMFAYVWEFPVGKFGVGFILDHVQKQRDGKPFGGKKLGTQVFQPVAAETEEESAADSDSEDATPISRICWGDSSGYSWGEKSDSLTSTDLGESPLLLGVCYDFRS